MLGVRFEVRLALGDQREHFVFGDRQRVNVALGILHSPDVGDAAAMGEDVGDGDFFGVGDLREELVERVGQLQFVFFDELQDHRDREHFRDRANPESAGRGQRLLFGAGDLAVADGAGVNHLAVFGDGQAAHCFILFGEAIEELVELGFVDGLAVGRRRQGQDQKQREESGFRCHGSPSERMFALRCKVAM